jgi:hypothetical protein
MVFPFIFFQLLTTNRDTDAGLHHLQDNSEATQEARLGDGCLNILLDAGANIGIHSRFLFEPKKYPNATNAHIAFTKAFGPVDQRDNRDL